MNAIPSNLLKITSHLERLSPEPVTLVAVSKLKSVSDIALAYSAGHRHFGENYVSELSEKCPKLPSDISWHMIGHLQSNKVKKLVSSCPNLFMIETIDSAKLASKVDHALKISSREQLLKVLVEVKTSSEDSKSGCEEDQVLDLIEHIRLNCPRIEFSGLMTIADPLDPEKSFIKMVKLKELVEKAGIPIRTLSMGMSGDYELAIKHGSTQVRIGSSIFGSR